jgi:hypothetical protein
MKKRLMRVIRVLVFERLQKRVKPLFLRAVLDCAARAVKESVGIGIDKRVVFIVETNLLIFVACIRMEGGE